MVRKKSDDGGIKRRSILKKAGIASLAATGMAGAASAKGSGGSQVSVSKAKQLVRNNAMGVLDTLASEGILDEGSLAELNLDEIATAAGSEGIRTFDVPSDVMAVDDPATRLMILKQVDGNELQIVINLDSGTAHAAYEPDDDSVIYTDDGIGKLQHNGPHDCTVGDNYMCTDLGCSILNGWYHRYHIGWNSYDNECVVHKVGCC